MERATKIDGDNFGIPVLEFKNEGEATVVSIRVGFDGRNDSFSVDDFLLFHDVVF